MKLVKYFYVKTLPTCISICRSAGLFAGDGLFRPCTSKITKFALLVAVQDVFIVLANFVLVAFNLLEVARGYVFQLLRARCMRDTAAGSFFAAT